MSTLHEKAVAPARKPYRIVQHKNTNIGEISVAKGGCAASILKVDWLIANKLSLNIQKLNFFLFHSHQKRATYSPKLDTHLIVRKVALKTGKKRVY